MLVGLSIGPQACLAGEVSDERVCSSHQTTSVNIVSFEIVRNLGFKRHMSQQCFFFSFCILLLAKGAWSILYFALVSHVANASCLKRTMHLGDISFGTCTTSAPWKALGSLV